MTCGIYRIINSKTGASYVGSSLNIEKRIKRHTKELLNGSHYNVKLLADFKSYGKDVFDFEILQEIQTDSLLDIREVLYKLEDQYIQTLKTKIVGYNIADAKFGNVLQYHPDKENIIKRREHSRKLWLDNLTDSQRQAHLENQYLGSANPNWKDHLCHNCKKCGKELSHHGKHGKGYCTSCRDRSGVNNPFYGKKHSEETIEKLRAINKNRTGKNNPLSKKVYSDGLIFDSMTECAKHLGKSVGTIVHRVKSPNFPNYYCL